MVILCHTPLSVGLVVIGLRIRLHIDLTGYLFGDILAVTNTDIYRIYKGGVMVLATLAF